MTSLIDTAVCIGDLFHVGTATIRVTQPRIPCYKLGIRMGNQRFVKRFLQSGRTGFYGSVAQEGEIAAGDEIALVEREAHGLTVADVMRLYVQGKSDIAGMQLALAIKSLAGVWHKLFQERLDRASQA